MVHLVWSSIHPATSLQHPPMGMPRPHLIIPSGREPKPQEPGSSSKTGDPLWLTPIDPNYPPGDDQDTRYYCLM